VEVVKKSGRKLGARTAPPYHESKLTLPQLVEQFIARLA